MIDKWQRHVAHMGERRNDYRVVVVTPLRKRPIGRTTHWWKDNIKTDLKETAWESMNWNNLVQDRGKWQAVLSTVQNLQVPYNAGSCLISRGTHSFSRRGLLHGASQPLSQLLNEW